MKKQFRDTQHRDINNLPLYIIHSTSSSRMLLLVPVDTAAVLSGIASMLSVSTSVLPFLAAAFGMEVAASVHHCLLCDCLFVLAVAVDADLFVIVLLFLAGAADDDAGELLHH